MRCLNPISIRNPTWLDGDSNAPRWLVVPCGRCPLCLARRRSDWAFRLQKHAKTTKNSFFVTLTYDNEFLPFDKQGIAHVSKRDCQNFLKRLRKRFQRFPKTPFSYYLCSEYGPSTLRPHYHMLIFDVPGEVASERLLFEEIMKAWKMGFVQCGYLQDGGAGYCCKYVLHPIEDFPEFLTKPFSLMSKGIGKNYVTEAITKYCYENGTYVLNTGKYHQVLPRYLRKKIFTDEELKLISTNLINELQYENEVLLNEDLERVWKYKCRPWKEQELHTKANRIIQNLKKSHKLSKL